MLKLAGGVPEFNGSKFLRDGFVFDALVRSWCIFVLVLGLASLLIGASGVPVLWGGGFLSVFLLMYLQQFQPKNHSDVHNDCYWNRLGILLVLLTSLAGFLYVWIFDSVQVSDAGVYFRCGTERHGNIEQWINTCQSSYLNKNLIFWTRSLLYSAPLGAIVGENYFAFKIYNATLHAGTIIFWFFGLRYYYGPRVATIAAFLLALYPEYWFTMTLVTTDNASLFCIVVFLLFISQIVREAPGALVVILLAAVLFAVNLLRTVGPILVLALVGWTIRLQCIKWQPYMLLRVILIIMIYAILNSLLGLVLTTVFGSLQLLSDPMQLLKILSSVDFYSAQDFGVNYPWCEHFWLAIPVEWRGWVGIQKIFLEFSHGIAHWPIYLYGKSSLFFSGLGYYSASSFNSTGFNPDSVFPVTASTVPFSYPFSFWLAAIIAFILTLSIWTLFSVRLDGPGFASLMWLGAFSLIILGFGEVQSRYSVLIAPSLCLLSAIALFPNDRRVSSPTDRVQVGHYSLIAYYNGLGFSLLLIFFGIITATAYYLRYTPSIMLASQESLKKTSFGVCNIMPVQVETSYKHLRITIPKGSGCVSINLPLTNAAEGITFFVSGSRLPFPFEPRLQSSYRYQVVANESILLNAGLEDQPIRWHKVSFPGPNLSVSIVINRENSAESQPIDFWYLFETETPTLSSFLH